MTIITLRTVYFRNWICLNSRLIQESNSSYNLNSNTVQDMGLKCQSKKVCDRNHRCQIIKEDTKIKGIQRFQQQHSNHHCLIVPEIIHLRNRSQM